jgi:hypothetical protein
LDDEDVLMGDVKKDANNPLLCLYHIYKYTHNFKKDEKNAQKYSNELIKILNLKNGSVHIFESSIIISLTKYINPSALSIYFDEISMGMYKNSKPKCIIIKSSSYNNTLSKQDMEHFSNKCNLKKIDSDIWILE